MVKKMKKSKTVKKERRKNFRRSSDKLREDENLYKIIADFTYDWVYWQSPDEKMLYVSPSCERITGYKGEEFIKNPSLLQKIIIPEDKYIWYKHHTHAKNKPEPGEVQFRIRRRDGQIRWIEHACQPIINEYKKFLGFRGSNRDITERKQCEEDYRISKAHLNRAQQVAHLGSWYLDLTKNELLWSDEIYRIFGISPASAMTYERFLETVHPEDRGYVNKSWTAALNRKPYDIEHRILVDGKIKWVREKAEVEFNKKGKAVRGIGTVQDITERKQSEEDSARLREELIHVTRVATMGELTAALAHELNQPLAAILSNAQAGQRFLEGKKPDIAEIKDILSDIVKDDKRAGEVILKLRALLKKSKFEFTQLNINELILEVIPLIRSDSVIKNISLDTRLSDNISLIYGDRIQLQQVILNLILNGLESMANSKSKKLLIRTMQDDKNNVSVSIRDSGTGINEKDMDNLFKPFFTTKKEGMGMGLAINKAIIEAHKGTIRAENNPDKGATFYFTLPVNKV